MILTYLLTKALTPLLRFVVDPQLVVGFVVRHNKSKHSTLWSCHGHAHLIFFLMPDVVQNAWVRGNVFTVVHCSVSIEMPYVTVSADSIPVLRLSAVDHGGGVKG